MSDFLTEIEAQIHFWPWSIGTKEDTRDLTDGTVECPFYGSPIVTLSSKATLILPTRFEKFIRLGPSYPPGKWEYSVYETPHGVLAGEGKVNQIQVYGPSGRNAITLQLLGAAAKHPDPSLKGDQKLDSDLALTVLAWSQFFDDLLDVANISHHGDSVAWTQAVDFIDILGRDTSEPRMALIVKIAERMQKRLPEIVPAIRRILLHERRLLPVARVAETDRECLRWYIRQSGETMPEKAGNRQKLLAVARRESYDTLENRILKDFLKRSANETQRYLASEVGQHPRYLTSKRNTAVKTYRSLCLTLSRESVFESISKPIPGNPPNYVLQNDPRYREIWEWYCRLLRREDEEDRFWDWQTRSWADITRLLVNSAVIFNVQCFGPLEKINDGVGYEEILTSTLNILKEQQQGCRTLPGTEPGPILVKRVEKGETKSKSVLEIIHPSQAEKHHIGRLLGRTGGHLYLVLSPLNHSRGHRKGIIVWGVNTAGSKCQIDFKNIVFSASGALSLHSSVLGERLPVFPELRGIVVANDIEATTATTYAVPGMSVQVVHAPTEPKYWGSTVLEVAQNLTGILREMI
jgi:hypothetical protein